MSTPSPEQRSVFRKKPVEAFVTETHPDEEGGELERSIGLFQLTMFGGRGATIGTGIFIVLSAAVPEAGPGDDRLLRPRRDHGRPHRGVLRGASLDHPRLGLVYSDTYATMGEITAFGAAACLLLEYGVSCAAVLYRMGTVPQRAVHQLFGFRMPDAILAAPGEGGALDLPAIMLVPLCCLLLVRGTRESARASTIMVLIKLAVLCCSSLSGSRPSRGEQLPTVRAFRDRGHRHRGGIDLLLVYRAGRRFDGGRGGTQPAEEVAARHPLRDRHRGHGSTSSWRSPGSVRSLSGFEDQAAGLAAILRDVAGSAWPAVVLSAGAVISIFSVTLVTLYGQTRILFAMGRDGMLPEVFHRVDPTTLAPVRNTIIVGCFVGVLAGFVPLGILIDLTSMGTLVAFTVVSIGVMILRRTQPDLPRGFRVPFYPVTPILSAAFALYIISQLPYSTFALFAVWLGIAAIIYFSYSRSHSRLADPEKAQEVPRRPLGRQGRPGRALPGPDACQYRGCNPYRVHDPARGVGLPLARQGGHRIRHVP